MRRSGTRLRLAQLPDPEYRLFEAQAVRRVEAHHRSSGPVVVPAGARSWLMQQDQPAWQALQPARSRASGSGEGPQTSS